MKNREKYKNELINSINENGRLCDFVKNHGVFRVLGRVDECSCVYCSSCAVLLQLWLDEECEEYEEPSKPEVDWSKIPVDTLVRVRDYEDEKWYLRYFKGIDDSSLYRFVTWESGTTSVTANDATENWNHCELVEDEDD